MTAELGEVRIRIAGVADAGAVARVHIASWRGAYAGIVPDDYLESLDEPSREASWRAILADTPATMWLAEAPDRPLGFASLGPCRDEDADDGDLEIYTIYLSPETWGLGVGRELMRTMLTNVPASTPVSLWVLADAARAHHFYRRHGFAPDGVERLDEIGGERLRAVRLRRRYYAPAK